MKVRAIARSPQTFIAPVITGTNRPCMPALTGMNWSNTADGFRIRHKRVDLINCDAVLGTIIIYL